MEFLCSSCGACCLSLNKDSLKKFGLPDNGNGVCANLNKDNSCSVYEDRPLVCRTKDMGRFLKKDVDGDFKDWYVKNTKLCHLLIDTLGLDSKYKIDIKEYDLQ